MELTREKLEAVMDYLIVNTIDPQDKADAIEVKRLALRGLEAQWRLIEEAPKDGTRVLLTGISAEPDEGVRWYGDGLWRMGDWYSGKAAWQDGTSWVDVTHFQPLPQPPEVKP